MADSSQPRSEKAQRGQAQRDRAQSGQAQRDRAQSGQAQSGQAQSEKARDEQPQEGQAGGGASPVDFARYGDYSAFRPKRDQAVQPARGQPARGQPARGQPANGQPANGNSSGEFVRAAYPFQGRITADGSSGYRAEPGRYHLYISWACPWAHRSAIVRQLVGLADVISLSAVDPVRDGRGWAFRPDPDPVNSFALLREAYEATEPGFDGHISVPVLWDKQTKQIVSNNFPDITIDLGTQFGAWATGPADLYPRPLRGAIDSINKLVYENVNNGVYRAGFATTQLAYHEAVGRLFATLDELDRHLDGQRYLLGGSLTEADVRLWVTLARFDTVYYSHFRTSIRRLTDYPNLWAYARDLYSQPAFRDTTDFDQIKRHYFTTHPQLNPSRIVPEGPDLHWDEPHRRARLSAPQAKGKKTQR